MLLFFALTHLISTPTLLFDNLMSAIIITMSTVENIHEVLQKPFERAQKKVFSPKKKSEIPPFGSDPERATRDPETRRTARRLAKNDGRPWTDARESPALAPRRAPLLAYINI